MKKVILIASVAICFGCSKSSTPSPAKPTNWIMGKWDCVSFSDTSFYFDAHKTTTTYPGFSEVLDFIDTSHVVLSTDPTHRNKYSLSNMTLTIPDYSGSNNKGNDIIYKITKLSDNEIKLYFFGPSNGEIGLKNIGDVKIYTRTE